MENYSSLSKKNALITGGTRGIGLAIANEFLKYGTKVYITGTKVSKSLPNGLEFIKCDFLDKQQLQKFSKKLSSLKIDILVNNAGINKINEFCKISALEFLDIHHINTFAPFEISKSTLPYMKKNKWGRIINISSIFGHISKEYRTSYSSSKFALDGITASLAAEVSKFGILVNTVSPGFIETDLTKKVLGKKGIDSILSTVPIGRLGQPEEIAKFVLWLSSDENSFISGQNLIIDGGFSRV